MLPERCPIIRKRLNLPLPHPPSIRCQKHSYDMAGAEHSFRPSICMLWATESIALDGRKDSSAEGGIICYGKQEHFPANRYLQHADTKEIMPILRSSRIPIRIQQETGGCPIRKRRKKKYADDPEKGSGTTTVRQRHPRKKAEIRDSRSVSLLRVQSLRLQRINC